MNNSPLKLAFFGLSILSMFSSCQLISESSGESSSAERSSQKLSSLVLISSSVKSSSNSMTCKNEVKDFCVRKNSGNTSYHNTCDAVLDGVAPTSISLGLCPAQKICSLISEPVCAIGPAVSAQLSADGSTNFYTGALMEQDFANECLALNAGYKVTHTGKCTLVH